MAKSKSPVVITVLITEADRAMGSVTPSTCRGGEDEATPRHSLHHLDQCGFFITSHQPEPASPSSTSNTSFLKPFLT